MGSWHWTIRVFQWPPVFGTRGACPSNPPLATTSSGLLAVVTARQLSLERSRGYGGLDSRAPTTASTSGPSDHECEVRGPAESRSPTLGYFAHHKGDPAPTSSSFGVPVQPACVRSPRRRTERTPHCDSGAVALHHEAAVQDVLGIPIAAEVAFSERISRLADAGLLGARWRSSRSSMNSANGRRRASAIANYADPGR